jgi:hypothetical protein
VRIVTTYLASHPEVEQRALRPVSETGR